MHNYRKSTIKIDIVAISLLLLAAGMASAQTVGLTATPQTTILPDGSSVPMWGLVCGSDTTAAPPSASAAPTLGATCAPLNPNAGTGGWSPVLITVPASTPNLTIDLANALSFTAGTSTNTVPTSLVIAGQLGGGLGDVSQRTTTTPPDHSQAQANTTWPIANAGSSGTPPTQGPRVQSFSTEVAAVGATAGASQCASPCALNWTNLRPGTYLIESGTHPSIQGPMGLFGILVVTTAPSGGTAGTAYPAVGTIPAVTYAAEVPLSLSEIDPVQNQAVDTAVRTAGFSETMVWSGQPGGCGNSGSATYHRCYPPAVNYTPLYYLINGAAFDKTNSSRSLFAVTPAPVTAGNVLVRLVNAGLRMHVPSIVGSQTGTAGAPGFGLIAEDGNPLPGVTRVQSEVFMAAGKTYDVMINASCTPAATCASLPIYDRELSLSGNAVARDAGMLAYLGGINGSGVPTGAAGLGAATANPDTYNSVVAGQTLTVSDVSRGVIANDVNIYGVQVVPGSVTGGTLTLNTNGTFSFVATAASGTFQYCGNGATTGVACATVTLGPASVEAASGITCIAPSYTASTHTYLAVSMPGVLAGCKDAQGYPLHVITSSITPSAGLTVSAHENGSFTATTATGAGSFTFLVQNSQGTPISSPVTASVTFPAASGLVVHVVDEVTKAAIADYRWIIEEDRTFYIDPTKTTNPGPTGPIVPVLGVNFHTSYMPVVAQGCTGPLSCESGQRVLGVLSVCDVSGLCEPGSQQTAVNPSQVVLDPTKRYYISVLPGDAANPFNTGNSSPGHGMGGAPVACTTAGTTTPCTSTSTFGTVTVLTEQTPLQPTKVSIFVFQDDFPLNGEHDAGGGVDILAPNEPGLGAFNITLFDDAGGTGDATGQMTYDMFNMPLSNSLAGTIDPANGNDACPVSKDSRSVVGSDPSPTGITGTIVTCPKYESDGTTLSPLAGQAVIANLMPGRYGIVATPGADRIARGEEWLQTNTLDGQKAHDSFLRVGEPSFFQEYGPAGYHVAIGFANPAIINARLPVVCSGNDPNLPGATNCHNSVTGTITTTRMSRPPDERLYSSGSRDSFAFTQCYVSLGDPDGEDFAFTKCNADGSFTLSGLPDGTWRITAFDQWNDQLVDGLSTPVGLSGGTAVNLHDIGSQQWQANIYTSTFFDANGNGVRDTDDTGLTLVATNIRFRDGSFSNFNNTDLDGNAGFNEIFPLFNWYVIETDSTRYKNTGTHVVYDAGGPADGSPSCGIAGYPLCGTAAISQNMANTYEATPLPGALSVPGAVYCDTTADCTGSSIASGRHPSSASTHSTGRIDPPWVTSEGWQGFSGQNSFIEFGKKPFATGETGGIYGHVIYASTRPFDDPQLLLQTSWEPLVPNVTINLYQEGVAADKATTTLTLVDSTKSSSWDDWAQGFRSDGNPNMNCPGQLPAPTTTTAGDLFFFSLFNQPNYLDVYNNQHSGTPLHTIPNNSQFKCYDGMHNWNQVQPAPYDGRYQFPSIAGRNPQTGAPVGGTGSVTGTNCTICVSNPTDGTPMLPAGKYVVEVVVPPGYELVKEEDKNILIGDNYIAPVTQQFGGLSNIFIIPDQAEVGALYNANNAQNPTQTLGVANLPTHEGDTGSIETFWPCVGTSRTVPDYISLFPQSNEVSPFAGATRNLCDRKEVTLEDQSSALAKFYIFSSTHATAHYTGVITDDFTSEFDPFSPVFGEKFAPPNMPISIRDFNYNEISRTYSDWWGDYDGLTYSTWEVNPPNPTGYAPTMMVTCMNDPGSGTTPDPLFNPKYSQFCYEIPFMPGQTQYMDTPVVPTSAFAGAGYNNPDCAYPAATPAVLEVDGDAIGPWVSAAGHTITIHALGDQSVNNYGYAGPAATAAPFNQKTVIRHYGFGARCTAPTAGSATCNTASSVTIGGVAATIGTWSDTQITASVPGGLPGSPSVPLCAVQQQAQYGGSQARCGELVITAGNGRRSIDAVTVTVGGKAPTHVTTNNPMTKTGVGSIQSAIDAAAPGDLIIVNPNVLPHNEMVLMWKPVRLQGVGAASSVINASTHPAGNMETWRRMVNCLFGLAINGQPYGTSNPYAPPNGPDSGFTCPWTGVNATYFRGGPNFPTLVVDRVSLEGILGWDASINGNLAEQLQEPSLMGAYEGGGITVLGKGVNIPAGATDIFGAGAEAVFPAGTTLLTSSAADCAASYPTNFKCNPSSIDGLGITNSSQGGGGIFLHGYGHNLEIANNRVYNNAGTLSGGMSIGQGEFPEALLAPNATAAATTPPGSCQDSTITNTQLPYCLNLSVNVHNNSVTANSSIGDELFSGSPAGAGGVSICTGADFYKFNYNWVCGNMSTGDGGGVAHLGFSYNGDIEHNSFLFNQSTNPTIQTNGGGLVVMGAPPDGFVNGTECGTTTDVDCVPGLSDGSGPSLTINANLFMGNAAEAGSGGGIKFQAVNGAELARFPNPGTCSSQSNCSWYLPTVTNNIIADNLAGWDGAGVSLEDALVVNFVNNTVVANDTTASAGTLFNTLGAPLSSSQSPPPTCVTQNGGAASCPQPAGLVSLKNSPQLTSSLPATITCPAGHFAGTAAANGSCRTASYPLLYNDIFWQNRSFYIGVGAYSAAFQQNVVALYDAFTSTLAPTQPSTDASTVNGGGVIITGGTGACTTSFPAGSYWDIGVRGDTGPANHGSGVTLHPTFSVLTAINDYTSANNTASNPTVLSQYCNGSRVPPEFQAGSFNVPPGIADATVPNPIFSLLPSATVDEGNNWVNVSWGPLSGTNPVSGTVLGNYSIAQGSPAINSGTNTASSVAAPTTDFFGNTRPQGGGFDVGAVELGPGSQAPPLGIAAFAGPTPGLASTVPNTNTKTGTVTVTNSASGANAGPLGLTAAPTITKVSGPAAATFSITGGTCVSGLVLNPGASCTIIVQYAPNGVTTMSTGRVNITDTGAATPSQSSPVFTAN